MATNVSGQDKQTLPWTCWMVRYVSANSMSALGDLIQSVQSVPPYGGVTQEEANLVLELVNQYLALEMASEQAYENLRQKIAGRREPSLILEAFRLHDLIVSRSAGGEKIYSADNTLAGLAIASKLDHACLRAYFLGPHASLLELRGEVPEAKTLALEALDILVDVVEKDPVYSEQTSKTALIAICFTAADGNFPKARELLKLATASARGILPGPLGEVLSAPPAFEATPQSVIKRVKAYLVQRDFYRALEWSLEAERLLLAAGDEAGLATVLGDQAEAYWRLRNTRRAIETYQKALEYCRKQGDFANASRWNQNLGLIFIERSELEPAIATLNEALSAALASRDDDLISTAMVNAAKLFQEQGRYQEAIRLLEESESRIIHDPKLRKLWRRNKFATYESWGNSLEEEGMVDEALTAMGKAVALADLGQDQEKESAAFMYARLGRLYESRNELQESGVAISRAIELFEGLGRTEPVNNLREVLRYQEREGLALREPEVALKQEPVSDWEQEVEQAVATHDRRSEALASVNLAASLLARGDGRAAGEFENALALVRAVQDRRGECVLLLNFIPHFLERKDLHRALEFARRGVELADQANATQRALAFLYLGEVWSVGFHDIPNALNAYRQTVPILERELQKNPVTEKSLITTLKGLLSQAARTAISSGDHELAHRLVELADPDGSKGGRVQWKPPKAMQKEDSLANNDVLREVNYGGLDFVLDAWRAARERTPENRDPDSPILKGMADDAQRFGWTDIHQRLFSVPEIVPRGMSYDAPIGLLGVAERLGRQEISEAEALRSALGLAVEDDDLPCLCLFSMQDFSRGQIGATVELLRLSGQLTIDNHFAGRVYKLLAMGERARRNPQQALALSRQGDSRLSEDINADAALRAGIKNESALALQELGRPKEALEQARQANQLVECTDDRRIAAETASTLGIAFMALQQWEEALAVFERLQTEQEVLGDKSGLSTTQVNLTICLAWLDRLNLAELDYGRADPDLMFNIGAIFAEKGERARSIEVYKRGLDRIAQLGEPYDSEATVRLQYSRLLAAAGRVDEACQQLRLAIPLAEKSREPLILLDIHSLLVHLCLPDISIAAKHAEEALKLARSIPEADSLAGNLGLLAEIRLLAGRPQDAIELLDQARGLVDSAPLRLLSADALVALRRFDAAQIIFEEELKDGRQIGDRHLEIQALSGLGMIDELRGRQDQALQLYRDAHGLAMILEPDDVNIGIFNQLGLALLNQQQHAHALKVLEQGLERANSAGLQRHTPPLINNIARALREIGDLEGARSLLDQSLRTSRSFGDTERQAIALFELGNVGKHDGYYNEALNSYRQALQIARHLHNQVLEAVCLDSIGSIYVRLDKPGRAIEYHQRAASLHAQLEAWDHQAVDLLNLGQAYLLLGELRQAKDAVEAIERTVKQNGIERYRSNLAFLKSRVTARLGDWVAARQGFIEAIEYLEQIRQTFSTPLEEKKWARQWLTGYMLAAEAAINASDAGSAFEFVECFRARFLESTLRRRRGRPLHVNEETWLHYEQAADRLVELRARRRLELGSDKQRTDDLLRKSEAEYSRSLAEVTDFDKGSQANLAGFQLPSFEKLACSIPLRYAAVSLEIYNEGLGVICGGRDVQGKIWHAARLHKTFKRSDLSRLLYGDKAGRSAKRADPASGLGPENLGWVGGTKKGLPLEIWTRTVSRTCEILGERVWPAILDLVPADTHGLVLMLGAGFNVLPLHAAQLSDGSRPCDRFTISFTPSLGLLRRPFEEQPLRGDLRLGQAVNPTADLRFSEVEARMVARCWSPTAARSLPGAKANVKNLLRMLQEADVCHFAGHGYFDPYDPMRSRLFCAPEQADTGSLTLSTILNRSPRLGSQFIILSACETGLTETNDEGNDFLGFPGALLVAGANGILSTLWRVDDLATALLLHEFAKRFEGEKRSAAEALQASQNWIRSTVTVDSVTDILADWIEMLPELEDQLLPEHGRWVARTDRNTYPFKDEIYWAAFYVTGLYSEARPTDVLTLELPRSVGKS
jgi:tetratricopeptide (TPR) repeat protein